MKKEKKKRRKIWKEQQEEKYERNRRFHHKNREKDEIKNIKYLKKRQFYRLCLTINKYLTCNDVNVSFGVISYIWGKLGRVDSPNPSSQNPLNITL